MKKPQSPPPWRDLLLDNDKLPNIINALELLGETPNEPYLHWADLRFREPPGEFDHTEWWAALKMRRNASKTTVSTPPNSGPDFWFVRTPRILESLAFIDRTCAGQIASPGPELSKSKSQQFVLSALREEAVQSSMLEGAATTRQKAVEMLRAERSPVTHGEKMVANNYAAIQWIYERRDTPLDPSKLNELHALLTHHTLEDEKDAGRPQEKGEIRVFVADMDGQILHRPPAAEHLPHHIKALCHFANGNPKKIWMHPVERAIICHFWMGWLHPYVDGNGRAARALFYWVMLRNGYWFTQYITISKFLRENPSKYPMAYMKTETDENDVTYFLLYQLKIILKAVEQAQDYVERKMNRIKKTEHSIGPPGILNHRQLALIRHALRHEHGEYTIKSHQNSHGVSYPTARLDLLELQEKKLLRQYKRGRALVYLPAEELEEALDLLRNS